MQSDELLSIPIALYKEQDHDARGNPVFEVDSQGRRIPAYLCGFCIGGGVDQDITKCPFGYEDSGVYVTYIYPESPAESAGLQIHDKILQVNGCDFNNISHRHAVESIKEKPTLSMLIRRDSADNSPVAPAAPSKSKKTKSTTHSQNHHHRNSRMTAARN